MRVEAADVEAGRVNVIALAIEHETVEVVRDGVVRWVVWLPKNEEPSNDD